MDTFLAVVGTLAFLSCAVVAVTLRLVHALRRRLADVQARAGLAVRAQGGGPYAEVARLRRDLRRSLVGARRALAVARAVDAPHGDVPSLLARLEMAGDRVDGELRLLEAQPDPARVVAHLPGPRSRAVAVTDAAADLVDGLLDAAGHGAVDVALLQAECSIEADALRAAAPAPPGKASRKVQGRRPS